MPLSVDRPTNLFDRRPEEEREQALESLRQTRPAQQTEPAQPTQQQPQEPDAWDRLFSEPTEPAQPTQPTQPADPRAAESLFSTGVPDVEPAETRIVRPEGDAWDRLFSPEGPVTEPQTPEELQQMFRDPGTAPRQRELVDRAAVDTQRISPWDFSGHAVGSAISGGMQKLVMMPANVGIMVSDIAEAVYDRTYGHVEGMFGERGSQLARILHHRALREGSERLQRYALSYKSRPGRLDEVEHWGDWLATNPQTGYRRLFEPNRLYKTLAEGVPLSAALLLLYARNPRLGFVGMAAAEASDLHQQMLHWEEMSGEEIPFAYKVASLAAVGSFNAYLERFQMERYIKLAKLGGNPSVRGHLFNIGMAGVNNALITGTQASTIYGAQLPYTGERPDMDDLLTNFSQGMYSGFVTGAALGGISGGLGAIRKNTPNDTYIESMELNEKGDYEPSFRIRKPGHAKEGQVVSLQEALQDGDLKLPQWRAAKLQQELQDAYPDKSPRGQVEVQETINILAAHASQIGYDSVDGYIYDNNIIVRQGEGVSPFDLLQVDAWHGSPKPDPFQRFDEQYIGTGEGAAAFGWGFYLSEIFGISKGYARDKTGMAEPHNLFTFRGQRFETPAQMIQALSKGLGVPIPEADLAAGNDLQMSSSHIFLGTKNRLSSALVKLYFQSLKHDGSIHEATFEQVRNDLLNMEQRSLEDIEIQLQSEETRLAETGNALHTYMDMLRDQIRQQNQTIEIIERLNLNDFVALPPLMGNVYDVSIQKGKQPSDYRWFNWRHNVETTDMVRLYDQLQKMAEMDVATFQKEFPSLAKATDNFIGEYDARMFHIREAAKELQGMISDFTSRGEVLSRYNDEGYRNTNLTPEPTRPSGASIYAWLTETFGSKKAASKFLWDIGFSGVKFRADAGQSSGFNYTVFDASILTINDVHGVDMSPDNWLNQTDIVSKKPKGAVSFQDGQTVLKFFEQADASTLAHEMSHIFRRTMPDHMQQEAARLYKVKQNKETGEYEWTREQDEQFSRNWERWLHDGGPIDHQEVRTFQRFRNWMMEIYARNKAAIGEDLSDSHKDLFDSMLDTVILEINSETGYKRTSKLAYYFEWFFDIFDIEARFDRIGAPDTGFNVKNQYSIEAVYEHEGADVVLRMARGVRTDAIKDAESVLMAESQSKVDEILAKQPEQRTDIENNALILREYLDKSRDEYAARGVRMDFRNRLLAELQEKIDLAETTGQQETYRELMEQLSDMQDISYVHIPVMFWLRQNIEKKPKAVGKAMIDLLGPRRKRQTPTIADLIEAGVRHREAVRSEAQGLLDRGKITKGEFNKRIREAERNTVNKEDVRSRDIIASYAKQKGRDFALLNIRQAAFDEGLVIPKDAGPAPPGFRAAPMHMRMFKDYNVHDVLLDFMTNQSVGGMNNMMGRQVTAKILRAINITKMWAFWNPFFLPMYDVIQAHMKGTINVMRPFKTGKQLSTAFQQVLDNAPEHVIAKGEGLSSTPFNNPLEQIGQAFDIAARTRHLPHDGSAKKAFSYALARGEHALADIVEKTFGDPKTGVPERTGQMLSQLMGVRPFVRNFYEMSWSLAWFLDTTVRQASYNHFREQGYTPREAAQSAAQIHGDYASVPPRTRKKLNAVLFTPTFKIAMGKWLADSVRSTGNVLAQDATNQQKDAAIVIMRTMAILGAFDMLMTSLDWERDEWGRRYVTTVDTPTGPRELAINWTGPFNLFLKYIQRAQAAAGPEVSNPIRRFIHGNSWELTPMWRIANSVLNNQTPGNEKIWMVTDDDWVKFAKGASFIGTSALNVLQNLAGEEAFGQEGAELFAEEYGKLWGAITAPFVFKYSRQPSDIRFESRLRTIESIMEEEIMATQLLDEIVKRGRDPQEVIQAYINGDFPFGTSLEGRSENLMRRIQRLIWQWENEHYNPYDEEFTRRQREVLQRDTRDVEAEQEDAWDRLFRE